MDIDKKGVQKALVVEHTFDEARHVGAALVGEARRDDGGGDVAHGVDDLLDARHALRDVHAGHAGKVERLERHLRARLADARRAHRAHRRARLHQRALVLGARQLCKSSFFSPRQIKYMSNFSTQELEQLLCTRVVGYNQTLSSHAGILAGLTKFFESVMVAATGFRQTKVKCSFLEPKLFALSTIVNQKSQKTCLFVRN